MVYFLHFIIFSSLVTELTSKSESSGICRRKELYRDGGNIILKYFSGKIYNGTISSGYHEIANAISLEECITKCLGHSSCITISYDIRPPYSGNCILLETSIYNEKALFKEKHFVTLGAGSRKCESKPCLNGGICVPVFRESSPPSFECKCRVGHYYGPLCRWSRSRTIEKVAIDFNLSKTAYNTELFNITLEKGTIVGSPDLSDFSLYCPGINPCVTIDVNLTSDNIEWFTKPWGMQNDCLITFWIKFRYGERERLPSFKKKTSVLFYAKHNLWIAYNHGTEKWECKRHVRQETVRKVTFSGGDIYQWHQIACSMRRNPTGYLDGKANFTIEESQPYGYKNHIPSTDLFMFNGTNINRGTKDPHMYIARLKFYPKFIDHEDGFIRDLYLKEKDVPVEDLGNR